jgi:sugar phosphate isomerase/epimerase
MDHSGLSISTAFDYALRIEEQLPLIAAAGFSHVSLGARLAHFNYLDAGERSQLKALLQTHHLRIDTLHGPRADQAQSAAQLTEVAYAAADLGARVVVCHATEFDPGTQELAATIQRVLYTCAALQPVVRATRVTFALENVMPGPASAVVQTALAQLPPESFGFCYDSAHDQIDGPRPFDLLDDLKGRVMAVHLSDRVRAFEDHVPPGDGFIDWPALAAHLRVTPFAGPWLFEVMTLHAANKEPRAFLAHAAERAGWVQALIGR